MDNIHEETLAELKEAVRILRQEQRASIPLSTLIEEGRTDVIIARGEQKAAKAAIANEKDYSKRQKLIIKNMSLFGD